MRFGRIPGVSVLFILVVAVWGLFTSGSSENEDIIGYTVDPKSQDLQLFWKDDSSKIFGSISNLKSWLEKKNTELIFATNGGMYMQDHSPLGLFIQEYKTVVPLNTASARGNFYLKPNGVFYLTKDNRAVVCQTEHFKADDSIRIATQSGPMLVIDGALHPDFKKGSSNLNVRNGVGILPDGKIIFAMSEKQINLYDFATYFRELGCKNALYLDGSVSRTYLPQKNWIQTDGDFGVIIGVVAAKK